MRFAFAILLSALVADAGRTQEPVRFNRDVRPILSEFCFACHGPDSAKRKAGLRLDTEDGLFGERDGVRSVVKGAPAKSSLLQRVLTHDAKELMPPPKSNKKLTDAQKETLRRWIADGGEYQPHWAFVKPARPATPAVKNAGWVRNPIDAFVLAKLESVGLTPAPEADKRTLARRAAFDLTGLPPTPEDLDAFLNDPSPKAYEAYVDRLLASKHWGEHRGRYWLDAARYGDTHGLHFDNYREMWPYRDWVISAFNRNQPFDQFTVEQLAGDLLPNRTQEQLVASGFHRCNITTNEGGSIAEEVLVSYARDRVETTGTVWLGLTLQCAGCHNHKYDPLTQKDFYQFAAYFRSTSQGAMDGNVKDTQPSIVVPSMDDRPRFASLEARLAALGSQMEKRKAEGKSAFAAWLAKGDAGKLTEPVDPAHESFSLGLDVDQPKVLAARRGGKDAPLATPAGLTFVPGPAPETLGARFGKDAIDVPAAGAFDADKPFSLSAWVYVPATEGSYTIASKVGSGPKDKGHGWRLTMNNRIVQFQMQGNNPKTDSLTRNAGAARLDGGKWAHVVVTYDGHRDPGGLLFYVNGKQTLPKTVGKAKMKSSIANSAPMKLGTEFAGGGLADVRVFDRAVNAEEVSLLMNWFGLRRELAKSGGKATPPSLALLYFNRFDAEYRKAVDEVGDVGDEMKAIKARSAVTHIMQDRPGVMPMARVLYRGEYDKAREEVGGAVPAVLHAMPKDAPNNRLGLARWIVSPDNPLTTRVTVNRFWQETFGVGLVRTAEDLGSAGEAPSHPELLDWMALEFRESGWDVKGFFKLLVTSATYRQASLTTPEKREKDPQNRLLSRGARFRMDGEVLRDAALAASGLLARKIGGPSVKPYQPDGVWDSVGILGASNTRNYVHDKDDGLYRRSMYWFWKRMAPPASMEIFNAPSRETCTVRRERTNTPLQALVTMNDPQFVEAARHLAIVALQTKGDDAAKVDAMTVRLLSRPFSDAERKIAQTALADFLAHYRANPKDAERLLAVGDSRPTAPAEAPVWAAWTMLANQLMNLDETLTK